ncbi:adenylate cyclase [Mucilaginibacter sp. PPCGB 2223]|uniref:CYTH domain-containing protein n=1 Tax=Mucilaginibacter sp. PPCGB 2223 TaxID=1886027 RepID=UPI0008263E20|nr:CYTH domain-containing protein [Mucilaginibacter sp. PPCGB 2223]OCX53356.1 adenylate cyclase [Mucilaginibacter sp. PPCGB 2223]
MGIEIERKFLVDADKWQVAAKPYGNSLRQGYMVKEPGKTIRVRIANQQSFITIKGQSHGATRTEYEYEIPRTDAEELLAGFCDNIISKVRYDIQYAGNIWEVDVFFGDNAGLIIAEIELSSEDQAFEKPDWVGEEVTRDKRYFNSNLSVHPYARW